MAFLGKSKARPGARKPAPKLGPKEDVQLATIGVDNLERARARLGETYSDYECCGRGTD